MKSNNALYSPPIRILLLDHHALVRAGLRLLLETRPGYQVVGETGDCAESLELAQSTAADIILLETNLNGNNSLDIIPDLTAKAETARLILVTAIPDTQFHIQAVQLGAMGVILKEQPAELLLKAIEKVHAGEVWIDRAMMASVLNTFAHKRGQAKADPEADKILLLTPREREVIALIGQGYKNKDMAVNLSISEITVRHHLTSIFNKLGVSDRLELTIYAYRYGLAELPR